MASTSKSTASASGKEQIARANTEDRKDPGHGFMYQTKLLMLFVHRGLLAGHTFRLATEMESAKKFDDLVYEYTVGESKIYRLLQAKHKLNNRGEKIRTDNLLTESDGDYSLVKYFFSYREIKEEKQFKGAKIQDVIVYTNIDFDHENLKKNNITLETIEKFDDILSMSTDHNLSQTSFLYRFGSDTIPILIKNVENYNLTRHLTKLTRQLVKCLLKYEVMEHDAELFKPYHMILAKEVINTQTNKFQNNFLAGCSLEETTLRFRTIFKGVFEKETDYKIKFADLNKAIDAGQEGKSPKIGLRFSIDFGKKEANKTEKDSSENALPGEGGWPTNAISSEEIKDFFDHLIFAVNQPNEDDLGNIIKTEIGKGFNAEWTQNVYSKFETNALRLSQGKEEQKWSPSSDWKQFFDGEKEKLKPIFFDIQDPDKSFTGREEQLNNLHEMLLKSESTAISQGASISGLGGIGKSELARMYISLHKSDFDNRIIWLNAESHLTLSESFRRLASETLGIVSDEPHNKYLKDIKSITEDVFSYFSSAKSLFVYDNAHENLGANGIQDFLPCSSLPNKPYVLITSRNCQWGPLPVISLDILTNEEATELIRKSLKIETDEQDNEIRTLSETLQFFPLALQQALAYIKESRANFDGVGLKFDIGLYLNRFEKETIRLLDFEFPNEGDDAYTKTTLTTWNMTIEKIRNYPKIGYVAIEVLNVMAFLGPDDIPSRLFDLHGDSDETLASALQLLKQFSMVKSGTDPKVMSIHRLVQLVTRLSLSGKTERKCSLFRARHACEHFISKYSKDNDYSSRRKFLFHTEQILTHLYAWCPQWREKSMDIGFTLPLLYTMGQEYFDINDFSRAADLHRLAQKILEYRVGPPPFDIPEMKYNLLRLGINLIKLGDYTKGKESLERVLRIDEGYYGCDDHIEIADTLRELATYMKECGDLTKVKELLERALSIEEMHYRSDNIDIAHTLNLLAICLQQLGDFTQAKELLERSLRIEESHNGFEVADTLCWYAEILHQLGEFGKEKEMLERALKIKETIYGSSNVKLADYLCLLARSMRLLGEYTKAKEALERSLSIQESHYGPENIAVAKTLHQFADTLHELREFDKAKELLERALRIEEGHYGSEHVRVTDTLCTLAERLTELNEYTKAKELLERALRITESHYGCENIHVANVLDRIAFPFSVMRERTKVEEFSERSKNIKMLHPLPHTKPNMASCIYLPFSPNLTKKIIKTKHIPYVVIFNPYGHLKVNRF